MMNLILMFSELLAVWISVLGIHNSGEVQAAQQTLLTFQVKAEAAIQELSPEFCWFHPRAAAIPGAGRDGNPAVIMTLMKHLAADDHYSRAVFHEDR